jgi:hypothetical protein
MARITRTREWKRWAGPVEQIVRACDTTQSELMGWGADANEVQDMRRVQITLSESGGRTELDAISELTALDRVHELEGIEVELGRRWGGKGVEITLRKATSLAGLERPERDQQGDGSEHGAAHRHDQPCLVGAVRALDGLRSRLRRHEQRPQHWRDATPRAVVGRGE